jgi:hypothetical protein
MNGLSQSPINVSQGLKVNFRARADDSVHDGGNIGPIVVSGAIGVFSAHHGVANGSLDLIVR